MKYTVNMHESDDGRKAYVNVCRAWAAATPGGPLANKPLEEVLKEYNCIMSTLQSLTFDSAEDYVIFKLKWV